ncbi:MAG: flagellar hook-basal body complex protein FliE [Proteobacteria bacterium]|nr:flagellar hook-basal body complex protein FliE [Pseudomonadota bacterium]NOG58936.1 flagellar hook-basal body complex protein FliE [Pseudomonadota bacterium]
MNEINMDQLLVQMRAMSEKASSINETAINKGDSPDFSNMFKNAVNQVNEVQQQAGELKTQFELGNPDIDITDVMVKSQVASLSFQAMTQVRNRLVSAYQEIMNMSV